MRTTIVTTLAGLLVSAGLVRGQTESLPQPRPQQPKTPAETAGAAGAAGAAGSAEAAAAGNGSTQPSISLPDGVSPYEYLGYGGRWINDFQILYWWNTNGSDLPPIVGNGAGGVNGAGEISLAGGVGASLDFRGNVGARLNLAYWCDHGETYGWEFNFLGVPETSLTFRTEASPAIGRQFWNALTGQESSLLVAFPGVATGNLNIYAGSQTWGGETNILANLVEDPIVDSYRLDVFAGFRYLEVLETLRIASVTSFFREDQPAEFQSFAGNSIQVYDSFLARNQFYGAQVGVLYTLFGEVGDMELRGKIAFGTTHQTNLINGAQIRNDAQGNETLYSGGLLALPSNIGKHTKEYISVLPELTASFKYRLCDNINLTLGGTFIFWNRVIRPGDQIDRNIDLNQLPNFGTGGPLQSGVARPGVNFNQSNYSIYGINMGVQCVW